MAFCKNCGTDIGDANLCSACGATQVEEIVSTPVAENVAPVLPVFAPDPSAYSSGMNTVSEPTPVMDNTYSGGSTIPGSMGSTLPGSGESTIPTYAAPVYSSPVEEKPKATGQIVFASINVGLGLILCCCSPATLLGMAVGVAALILAIISRNAATASDAASKLKIALILNIIAVVVIVGAFVISFAMSLSSGMPVYQEILESLNR